VPRKKSQPALSRDELLGARPHRNSALESEALPDGRVRVHAVRTRGGLGRVLAFFFVLPKTHLRNIDLDDIGSFVWKMCDGKNAVREIRDALVGEYKLSRREAETALMEYLKQLMKRKLVGLEVPGKPADLET